MTPRGRVGSARMKFCLAGPGLWPTGLTNHPQIVKMPNPFSGACNFWIKKVADILSEKHAKESKQRNRGVPEPAELQLTQKVWYRRPEGTGDKLDSRWLGPGVVTGREGEHSYVVEIKPGVNIKAHRSFLKPYWEDKVEGEAIPLYFHLRTVVDPEAQPDEWTVEKILRHRVGPGGKLEFLTQWRGYGVEDSTWEPVNHFIHRYSSDMVQYCKDKDLRVDLTRYLSPTPQE